MPNTAVNELNLETLTKYLEQNVEGFKGPVTADKFSGGQSNPTFLLKAASGEYVLRRQPPGELLKSAHAVDREFKVMHALADTDVPVAKAYHLCEDRDIIGSMFYVMSFENGEIYWDPALPEIEPSARKTYYDEIIRIMAAIHNVDVNAVGLSDYGRPGNYFERQIGKWTKQYRSAETDPNEKMETLIAWLEKSCPEDDGSIALVHGDFRFDNVIFKPGEANGLAVLDWELSTLGHPLADLAYFCMSSRLPSSETTKGLGGKNRAELQVPEEEEVIAMYCKERGIDGIDNWNFYLAFSFFRLASIVQGVYKRALMGNASNSNALEIGKLVAVLATMACELFE